MNKWIDVHTHLQMLEMSPKDAIEAGKLVGVEKLITIGTSPDDHDEILRLAESYDENVYCTLGVHPHDASQFNDSVSQYLLKHINHPRLVAIGEIGLDFYYNESSQDIQMDAFRKQYLDIKEPMNLNNLIIEDIVDGNENFLNFDTKQWNLVSCKSQENEVFLEFENKIQTQLSSS